MSEGHILVVGRGRAVEELVAGLEGASMVIARVEVTSEACQLATEEHFDAAVLDLSDAGDEDLDSFVRLQAQEPDLPKLVITDDESVGVLVVQIGALEFLATSASPGVVQHAIARAIESTTAPEGSHPNYFHAATGLLTMEGFDAVARRQWDLAWRTGKSLLVLAAVWRGVERELETRIHAARIVRASFRAADAVALFSDKLVGAVAIVSSEEDSARIILERLAENVAAHNYRTAEQLELAFKARVIAGHENLTAEEVKQALIELSDEI